MAPLLRENKAMVFLYEEQCVTIVCKLGNEEIVAMEGASRQSNAQDQSLLLVLEHFSVGSFPHLFQELDKVLGIRVMTTSLLVGRARKTGQLLL